LQLGSIRVTMSMGLYVVNVYGRMNEWALTHSGHFIGKRHTLAHM